MAAWLYVVTLAAFTFWFPEIAVQAQTGPSQQDVGTTVRTPPEIAEPSYDDVHHVYHRYGTPLMVICKAKGSAPITYRWLWDGKAIDDQQKVTFDPDNGTLYMPHGVTSQEEGDFQCRASNQYGTAVSQTVRIRAKAEPDFPDLDTVRRTVTEGKGVTLECAGSPRFVPAGFYHWYLIPRDPNTQNKQVTADERMSIDANGTLYIMQAQKSDQYSDQDYACALQDRDRKTIRISDRRVSLEVESFASAKYKPVLLGASGSALGQIGKEVLLECFFSGNPLAEIQWKNPINKEILNSGFKYHLVQNEYDRKLRILNLTEDDEGIYRCQAQNSVGSEEASIFLNVTSRPIFETRPGNAIAPRGSDASFTCFARPALHENPLAPPVWFINGQPFDNVTLETKYTFKEDNTTITFHDVSDDSVMNVLCNVSNEQGYVLGSAYLTVIDPLVITGRPLTAMEVELGDTVTLNISATADPCCPLLFSWYLNDTAIKITSLERPPYRYKREGNSAYLEISFHGDEQNARKAVGRYRCHVWHPFYTERNNREVYNQNVTTDITMLYNDTQPVTAAPTLQPEAQVQSTTSLWWVAILCGIIVLIIAAVVIFLMVHYNFPRQEYLLEKEEKKHQLNPEKDLLDQSFTEI